MENSPSQFIGERGMIERSQFVRLILQSLCSLGFSRAASTLESESGIRQDSPEYSSLASQTLAGQWEGCVATVNSISDLDPESKSAAQFLIWKEHFLELLGSKNGLLPAKQVLLERISTLDLDRKKVHRLARALIDMEGAVGMEERGKRRMGLLTELVGLMPDWIRVPSGRLEQLVEMAVMKQLDSCFYHNSPREISLYEDHECSRSQIPCKCSQVSFCHQFVVIMLNNKFPC